MDTTIANQALELAMAWGADWLKPTQSRLKLLSPALSDEQLNDYDALARDAMTFGFDYMYKSPECAREQFAATVRARFPWVSDENVTGLYSQGMYYATK